jgi:hypothetical protein
VCDWLAVETAVKSFNIAPITAPVHSDIEIETAIMDRVPAVYGDPATRSGAAWPLRVTNACADNMSGFGLRY